MEDEEDEEETEEGEEEAEEEEDEDDEDDEESDEEVVDDDWQPQVDELYRYKKGPNSAVVQVSIVSVNKRNRTVSILTEDGKSIVYESVKWNKLLDDPQPHDPRG